MPELPEVETVRRGLEKYIVGHVIDRVEIINQGPFQGDVRKVEGAEVIDVRRSGKGLIIDLNNKYSLAIHIKLTGQIVYRDKQTDSEPLSPKVGTLPNKFTHIIFHLDRGGVLYYNDQRRFGWIKVIKTSEISSLPFFKNMGPEPFGLGVGPELTLDLFKKILSKASTKIKPFIMDQTKIGGIGNIYANDVLFKAKIDPRRSAKS
ncbi:MAG: DNA-formamidopyrimidine glycosylase family protein, partial [Candidatus Levybacteria bacterium]|nr:DNA-formamidopyrimidine glycosylase family protein [Candidatus Levybacteria bacterium]